MRFEWDQAKNRTNLRKHGLDLAEAVEMFFGHLLIRPDTREDYGEYRWIGHWNHQRADCFRAFHREFTRDDPNHLFEKGEQ